MKKRINLIFCSLILMGLWGKTPQESSICHENCIRYVSTSGNDSNTGLSPNEPWQTLAKLNQDLPSGGEARLKCGDIFYGELRLQAGLNATHRTTVTSYGVGPAPEICGYKIAHSSPDVWKNVSSNLWQIDLSDRATHTGNHASDSGNVGFIKMDETIFGAKFFHPAQLQKKGDFYDDHHSLTLYWDQNPAQTKRTICFAVLSHLAFMTNHLALNHLVFRGTGGHGICSVGCDVRLSHCAFVEIGGAHLANFDQLNRTRFGNGIECWAGSSDIQVTDCFFSQIYDTGFTMQGPAPVRSWENIVVRDCYFEKCSQCFEIWTRQCAPQKGFRNCLFERNTCVDTGWGWAWAVRPDKKNSTPLLIYDMETDFCDVLVRQNRFIHNRQGLIFKSGGLADLPPDYKIENNCVIGSSSLGYENPKKPTPTPLIQKLKTQNHFFHL